MADNTLFRTEALDAQRTRSQGGIVLTRPLSHGALTLLFTCLAVALVAFSIYGTYTKRVTVAGQLVPDRGLIKVYVQQSGIVAEERVGEGQAVKAGDVLFVLSSERESSTMGETQAVISRETEARRSSLRQELAKTQQLSRLERQSLLDKLDTLHMELATLQGLIEDQQKRFELSSSEYQRYESIRDKGYVSQDELTQKQADVIDQKSRLESLERDRISTRRNLADAQYQLDSLDIKYAKEIGDISRSIASTVQDLSESEARRRLMVIAPGPGTVTAITVHLGQAIDNSKPLVSLIPEGSRLQVELYAPSRAIGFVQPGDEVHIRYQAYPYQKFGQYSGTVTAVANATLSSAEMTGTNAFSPDVSQQSEPLYRILVGLPSQTITAYGQVRRLHAGAVVEADLLQQRRRLYEWVLEPLYSVSGKL